MRWKGFLATVALAVIIVPHGEGKTGEENPPLRVGLSVASLPQFPELGRRFEVSAGSNRETLRGPLTVRSEPPEQAAQVGVFTNEKNAQAFLSSLQGKGFAAELVPGNGRFRVLVPVPPGFSFTQLKGRLKEAGFSATPAQRRPGSVEVLGGEGGLVRGETITVTPLDPVPVMVGNRRYRGSFLCLAGDQGPVVVNVVPLEDYLLGVVPAEMGPKSFPHLEALKAQAVAARSYALAQVGAHAFQGFDLCDQEHCQVYLGADSEEALSSQAVADTRGEVLVYGGEVVRAYFHSTCGGYTEAGAEVFPGKPAPYLTVVPCFGEVVELGVGQESQRLDQQGKLAFLVRHLASGKNVGTPLEFAQALGQGEGRTPEEALGLPDFQPLLGRTWGVGAVLWHFRLLQGTGSGADPWAIVLQLARLSGAVQVREGVVVGRDGGPRWRQTAGGSELSLEGVAVLWDVDGELRAGAGQALTGSPARLWCTARGCPVVEVEAHAAADARAAFRGWIREWKASDVALKLGVRNVTKLEIARRTAAGRVAALEMSSSEGKKVLSGLELRRVLSLPSTWFVVGSRQEMGELRFRFFGKGWGHGVGLCQNGAYGLSLGGWNYQRILTHYYPGTQIVRFRATGQKGGS